MVRQLDQPTALAVIDAASAVDIVNRETDAIVRWYNTPVVPICRLLCCSIQALLSSALANEALIEAMPAQKLPESISYSLADSKSASAMSDWDSGRGCASSAH